MATPELRFQGRNWSIPVHEDLRSKLRCIPVGHSGYYPPKTMEESNARDFSLSVRAINFRATRPMAEESECWSGHVVSGYLFGTRSQWIWCQFFNQSSLILPLLGQVVCTEVPSCSSRSDAPLVPGVKNKNRSNYKDRKDTATK